MCGFVAGWQLFAAYIGISVSTYMIYRNTRSQIEKQRVEMRSSTLAMLPLLLAERDREHLKTMYRNREAEAKLMADVPGWKVIDATLSYLTCHFDIKKNVILGRYMVRRANIQKFRT